MIFWACCRVVGDGKGWWQDDQLRDCYTAAGRYEAWMKAVTVRIVSMDGFKTIAETYIYKSLNDQTTGHYDAH